MAKKVRKTIMVGPELWQNLQKLSNAEDQSMSSLIREALIDLFNKRQNTPGRYNPVTDSFD